MKAIIPILAKILTLAVCVVVWACVPAAAQTTVSIPNGNFEGGTLNNTPPTDWSNQVGLWYVRDDTSGLTNCASAAFEGLLFVCINYSGSGYESMISSDVSLTGAAGVAGASFTLPYAVQCKQNSGKFIVSVEQYSATAQLLAVATTGVTNCPPLGEWHRDDLVAPPVTGIFSADVDYFRVKVERDNIAGSFDAIGPLVYAPASGGGIDFNWDDWPGDASSVFEWLNGEDLAGDLASVEQELQNFVCAADLTGRISSIADTATSVAGIIGGLFGGGAEVMILIKQLKNMKKELRNGQEQLCEAVKQTAISEAIWNSTTNPQDIEDLSVPVAMSDPESAALAQQYAGVMAGFPTEGDDLVTASNRTNRLLVANAQMQMAAYDRMLGEPAEPYETDRGPKITEADLVEEPNLEFAEGDYSQTLGRMGTLADGEAVQPEFLKRVDVQEAMVEVTGSCFSDMAQPTADGTLDAAMSVVRWNAAQTLAGSDLGLFICSFVDQPPRVVTEICLAPAGGIELQSGLTVMEPGGFCIYGSQAPAFWATLWDVLPSILMMVAAIGVFKLFF